MTARAILPTVLCAAMALWCSLPKLRADGPEAPPAGATVLRARYEGTVAADTATFVVRVDARRLGDAWGELALPPGDYRLASWSCEPAGAVRLLSEGTASKFLLQGEGDTRLEIRLELPVVRNGAVCALEVPLLPAAAAQVELVVDGRDLEFAVSPDAPMETPGADGNRVRVAPAPGRSVTIEWHPRDAQASAGPAFRIQDRTRFHVGAGVVEAAGRYRLVVERGGVERVALRVDALASVLAVEGESVSQWYMEDRPDHRLLHIRFAPRVTRETVFRVRHDAPIAALPGVATLAPPAVVDAREQSGTVALDADQELAIREDGAAGVERIEPAALQAAFPEAARVIRAGWNYSRLPATVTLAVERKQPRLRVAVESSVLIEKDALVLRSVIAVTVDEIGANTLRFRRPADLEILTVTGASVRDWRASDDVLEVHLVKRSLGTVAFQVEASAATPGRGEVALPRLELLDAVGAEEVIGVVARGETAVDPAGVVGMAQIDAGELPSWLRETGSRLGYRLRERTGEVRVSVAPLEPEVRAQVLSRYRIEADRVSARHHVLADVARAPVFAADLRLPTGQEPVKVEGAAIRDWTFRESDRVLHVEWTGGRLGALDLAIETEDRRATAPGTATLGGVVWQGAREQRGWAAVGGDEEIDFASVGVERAGEMPVTQLPEELRAGGPRLAYRCAEPTWSVRVSAQPLDPRIQARSVTVAEIRRGLVTVLCVADLTVERAGVRRLRVALPPGALNSRVDADGLQGRRFEEGVWELTFIGRRKGALRITAGWEMPVPDDDPQVRVTPVTIAGVERMEGTLLVARDQSGAEVEMIRAEGTSAIRREDLAEEFRDAALAYTHLLAFARTPVEAVFRVTTHARGQVEAAHMGLVDLHTIVQPDGDALTYLSTRLTNTNKQYLELGFPDGVSVWGGEVNGEPVKISVGAPGKVRFPLPRVSSGQIQCDLSVTWIEKVGALGLASKPSFQAPVSDVKMEGVRWSVHLPGGYHMLNSDGSLRLVAVQPGFEAPRLFARMQRALEASVPTGLMVLAEWLLKLGAVLVGAVLLCAILLWLRDRLADYGIGSFGRSLALGLLVLSFGVMVLTVYGRQMARLFKASTQSLDRGAPMPSAQSEAREINTSFELSGMGSAGGGGGRAGRDEIERPAGLVQNGPLDQKRPASREGAAAQYGEEATAVEEAQDTIGNFRQDRKAKEGKGVHDAIEPKTETTDHNESSDQEDLVAGEVDMQRQRGQRANDRLKQLERVAKESEEAERRAGDDSDVGATRQAGGRLEQALAGKKAAAPPAGPADPGASPENAARSDLEKIQVDPRKDADKAAEVADRPGADSFAGVIAPERQPSTAPEPKPTTPEQPPVTPEPNLGLLHAQSNLQAADAMPFRRVERGMCEAALPIAVSFPIAGTHQVQFEELALAGGDARLQVWCVATGMSLGIQLSLVGLIGLGLIGLGMARPRAGLLVAALACAALMFGVRGTEGALAPYLTAAAGSAWMSFAVLGIKALAQQAWRGVPVLRA